MTKKLFALFFLTFLLTGCMENTVTPTEKEGTSATDGTLPAETGNTVAPATTEPTATEPTTTQPTDDATVPSTDGTTAPSASTDNAAPAVTNPADTAPAASQGSETTTGETGATK